MKLLLSGLSAVILWFLSGMVTVFAAPPHVLLSSDLHALDASITGSLGYSDASVVYFGELASITTAQLQERIERERIGCSPYFVMHEGKIVEKGYNCRTFYCVGYQSGPKICRDTNGKPYGGVVEIERRLAKPYIELEHKAFASFDVSDRSDVMKKRIRELAPVRCSPFYLMLFDVAVGEGFTCQEVGDYPYFSPENTCENDWRDTEGLVCEKDLRENEMEIRARAIALREDDSGTGDVIGDPGNSDTGTGTVTETGATIDPPDTESGAVVSFSDVIAGKYGYTAIMDLARKGIIHGYDDGTFRPYQTVNRAEFAKMFIAGLMPQEVQKEIGCFPDVARQWFAPYVCAMKRLAWVRGYDDGRYHADRTIKRAEGMKVVISALGIPLLPEAPLPLGTSAGQWYSPYISTAVANGIILESSFYPAFDVTRADAAVWMYRARRAMGL